LLGDWDRPERRPAAVRRLRHARDLVGFDSILKPPDILMAEAIRSYAEGLPAPSPYLLPGDEQRGRIIDMLTSMADGKDEYTGLVLEVVAAVRAMKARSKVDMEDATRQARAGIDMLPPARSRLMRPARRAWPQVKAGFKKRVAIAHRGVRD